MLRLENWLLCSRDLYRAPETQRPSLQGIITGHDTVVDGSILKTSPIASVQANVVTTESGSTYLLGTPDPKYIKWCEENGVHVPTDEVPIKCR